MAILRSLEAIAKIIFTLFMTEAFFFVACGIVLGNILHATKTKVF